MKNNMIKLVAVLMALVFVLSGCGADVPVATSTVSAVSLPASTTPSASGARDTTPKVLVPTADAVEEHLGNKGVVDTSNSSKGYIMVKYTGTNTKVKMQLTLQGGSTYTYDLNKSGLNEYEVFPLSQGSGSYSLTINENISGTSYAVVDAISFSATLEDEYSTFLYPNQYVNFNAEDDAIKKSQEVVAGAANDLEVIEKVFDFVTGHVSYDYDLAANISGFFLPDIDVTLETGKGICFDYAVLMTSMLRAQGIPTKLVIGYSGQAYHAWISTYTEETGWVVGIIYFDGVEWVRMDPTFASTANMSEDILNFVGDGENYSPMYIY